MAARLLSLVLQTKSQAVRSPSLLLGKCRRGVTLCNQSPERSRSIRSANFSPRNALLGSDVTSRSQTGEMTLFPCDSSTWLCAAWRMRPSLILRQKNDAAESTSGTDVATSSSDWDVGRGHEYGSGQQQSDVPPGSGLQLQDRAGVGGGMAAPPNFQVDPEAEVESREAATEAGGVTDEGSAGSATTGREAFSGNVANADPGIDGTVYRSPQGGISGTAAAPEGDIIGSGQRHGVLSSGKDPTGKDRTAPENLGSIRQERVTSDLEVMVSSTWQKGADVSDDVAKGEPEYNGFAVSSFPKLDPSQQEAPLPEKAPEDPPPPAGANTGAMAQGEDGHQRMVLPTEGHSVWVMGTHVTVKVPGSQTDGKYSLFEYHMAPGKGASMHRHASEDETWYLLEGQMEWRVGSNTFQAAKGSYLHLPKGVSHSYHNISRGTAHMLVHCMPSGIEEYFLEVGAPTSAHPRESGGPPSSAKDMQRTIEGGEKYGVVYDSTSPTTEQADS